MANLHPEIGRMYSYLDSNKTEASKNAQKRALDIVEKILSFEDIKPAGKKEWNMIKNFILNYQSIDLFERKILERYAEPFSYKFMNQYSLN